ncbi:MAG TPA: dihydrodipicolinate reductase C-terminal domain-containing protein [Candidatus Acidoferrales bacterium]|nr:dihydrodipicolinate reductase C-terminal domain-containing protein [Candidatus Acidoferrales bacterium]
MDIIHVAVGGASGRLGSIAVEAFCNNDAFDYVGGYARVGNPSDEIFDSLDELLGRQPQVWFDALTLPASFDATMKAVAKSVRPVIGTSGWDAEQRAALAKLLEEKNIGGLIVPNFSLGAILMMRFAEAAAPLFSGVEIVEMHRASKKDKPSGTAAATAARIAAKRKGEVPPIHSVRLPGLLAHQEVMFGGAGEVLTIRHDSLSYESFVPGMLLAAKAVMNVKGLVTGLDSVLF